MQVISRVGASVPASLDANGGAHRKTNDSRDDRWRSFHITEVRERGFKLDSFK